MSSPKSLPPVGAGRAPGDHWFEPVTVKVSRPWAFRSVSRTSGGIRTRYQYFDLGMAREARAGQSGPEPAWAPRPTCALGDLWKAALDQGAPKDAVAVIRYDAGGYRYTIEGTRVDLAFGLDCALRNVRQ